MAARAHPHLDPRVRASRVLLLAVACLLLAALAAGPARADVGGWSSHPWSGCGGGTNSGGWDDAGLVYVPCGNPSTIAVYDQDAHLVRTIAAGRFVTDVAPTRDGRYLYLAGDGELSRLVRGGDGTYAPDAAWRAERFSMWGKSWAPQGRYVATDAAGNVYLADGTWTQNLAHTVVKYDPSGRVVTRFGEWANSWGLGTFYWALAGLAVTGDGSVVYTAEIGNNRIQRWERQGDGGGYAAVSSFGSTQANNATREGWCDYAAWRGTLAAPYDVALDGAGNVYVINTTCKQVLGWSADLGTLRLSADVRVAGGDYPRPHGFTVGRDGTVYVGENARVLRPAGGALPGDGGPPSGATTAPPVNGGGAAGGGGSPAGAGPGDRPGAGSGGSAGAPGAGAGAGSGAGSTQPDRTAPVVRIGRVEVFARALRVRIGCNERCRVHVIAVRGRRVVSRRIAWIGAGRDVPLVLPVGAAGLGAAPVTLRIDVRDAAGNAAAWRRVARR